MKPRLLTSSPCPEGWAVVIAGKDAGGGWISAEHTVVPCTRLLCWATVAGLPAWDAVAEDLDSRSPLPVLSISGSKCSLIAGWS